MAARLIPRCELECMDRPSPKVSAMPPRCWEPQAAPEVVVGEHNVDGAGGDRGRQVVEAHHAHVGCQREV